MKNRTLLLTALLLLALPLISSFLTGCGDGLLDSGTDNIETPPGATVISSASDRIIASLGSTGGTIALANDSVYFPSGVFLTSGTVVLASGSQAFTPFATPVRNGEVSQLLPQGLTLAREPLLLDTGSLEWKGPAVVLLDLKDDYMGADSPWSIRAFLLPISSSGTTDSVTLVELPLEMEDPQVRCRVYTESGGLLLLGYVKDTAGWTPSSFQVVSPAAGNQTAANRFPVIMELNAGVVQDVTIYADSDRWAYDGYQIGQWTNSAYTGQTAASSTRIIWQWDIVTTTNASYELHFKVREKGGVSYVYAPGTVQVTTPDLTGPTLEKVLNVDGGSSSTIEANDRSEFYFSEAIDPEPIEAKAVALGLTVTKQVPGPGQSAVFGPGLGSISGPWANQVSILGSFSEESTIVGLNQCVLTLSADGTMVVITIAAAGPYTGIEAGGLFLPDVTVIRDLSGNAGNADQADVTRGWKDVIQPYFLEGLMIDGGSPTLVTAGDYFLLKVSEPLALAPIIAATANFSDTTVNSFAAGQGNITGSWNSLTSLFGNFSLTGQFMASFCTLTANATRDEFTITIGGTISNTAILPREAFIPRDAWLYDDAGNTINRTINARVTGSWLDTVMPTVASVEWVDGGSLAEVAAGDKLVVTYSEAIDYQRISLAPATITGIVNESFLPGSGHLRGDWLSLLPVLGAFESNGSFDAQARLYMSADMLTLTLELLDSFSNAYDRPYGKFRPSGIYVTDLAGNTVLGVPLVTTSGTWTDTRGPTLVSITMADNGSPEGIAAGDQLNLVFDEAVSRDKLYRMVGGVAGVANFSFQAGSGYLRGNFSSLALALGSFSKTGFFDASSSMLTLSADAMTVTISLGSLIVEKESLYGGSFTPSGNFLTDNPGNKVDTTAVTVQGSWTESTRPTVTAVTLADIGTGGPEAGDTLTIAFSEAISLTGIAQIAQDLQSVNNESLARGSGYLEGDLWSILSNLGSFSTPGDIACEKARLSVNDNGDQIILTLVSGITGTISPSGIFTPLTGYLADTASNPIDGSHTVPTSGDFGILPLVSSLGLQGYSVEGNRGWVSLTFNLSTGGHSCGILPEWSLDATTYTPVPVGDLQGSITDLGDGFHTVLWNPSSTIGQGLISGRGSLWVRLTPFRTGGTHYGSVVISKAMVVVDFRNLMPLTGSWTYNNYSVDSGDTGGSTGDITLTAATSGQWTTISGPSSNGATGRTDRWSSSAVSEPMFMWGGGGMGADVLELTTPAAAFPIVTLAGTGSDKWTTQTDGTWQGGYLTGITVTVSIQSYYYTPSPSPVRGPTAGLVKFTMNIQHPSLPSGGFFRELSLASGYGVSVQVQEDGSTLTLK